MLIRTAILGWAQWHTPINPVTQEAKEGESQVQGQSLSQNKKCIKKGLGPGM